MELYPPSECGEGNLCSLCSLMSSSCLATVDMTLVSFLTSFVMPCCSKDTQREQPLPDMQVFKMCFSSSEVHGPSFMHSSTTELLPTPGTTSLGQSPFPAQSSTSTQWRSKAPPTLPLVFFFSFPPCPEYQMYLYISFGLCFISKSSRAVTEKFCGKHERLQDLVRL